MIQRYSISRDDSTYEAFPDVAMTAEGELICVFLECEHHGIRKNVRIAMSKSSDMGKTWSKKEAFTDYCDDILTYDCPRISRLPDDSLAVICNIGEHFTENVGVQHIWFSYDNGKTWTEPKELPLKGIVPDKYRVLSNGRHITAAHMKNESGKLEQYAYYSDDRGKNWKKTVVGADPRYNLCEACIVEVKPGTLVAFMRENSGLGYPCLKSISHDYGTTWEGVYETNIDCAHRPVVDFYEDGKLLMTYRYFQGGKGAFGDTFQNLFGAFFDVDTALATERTEQTVRIFPISYDRSPKSDTGYSGWVYFGDGRFYVVNYLMDDAPKAQIAGYSFEMSDVIFGK